MQREIHLQSYHSKIFRGVEESGGVNQQNLVFFKGGLNEPILRDFGGFLGSQGIL